jgi:hypothetical protein
MNLKDHRVAYPKILSSLKAVNGRLLQKLMKAH